MPSLDAEVGAMLMTRKNEAVLVLADGKIERQNDKAAELLQRAVGDVFAVPIDPHGRPLVTLPNGARILVDVDETKLSHGRSLVVARPRFAELARASEEMSDAILSGSEVEHMLEAMSEITGRALEVDRSFIYEIRVDTQELVALCQWLNPSANVAPTRGFYPLSVFSGGDKWAHESSDWLESHQEQPHPYLVADGSARMLHGPMAIRSLLWAPFGFRESRYYALVLNQVGSRRAWLPEEREYLRVAIRRVSAALRQLSAKEQQARTERAILEAQKLETIRLLAGGVAHDLGSHLGIVMGAIDRVKSSPLATGALAGALRDAESATVEAGKLAKRLLAYSGNGQFVVEPIDLGAVAEDMGPLLQAAGGPVKVVVQRATDDAWMQGDAIQIRQVLMNLVVNAVEAIGSGMGSVVIRVLTDSREEVAARSAMGKATVLEVSDNGPGMPPELQQKILEPFFSTKGEGRGLGLAAVAGIVRGHDGALHLQSQRGKGTTFRLAFPAVTPAPQTAPPPASQARKTGRLTGTVLLADDVENLRRSVGSLLEMLGFHVIAVADGAGIEAELARHPEIDVLVFDWTMSPGGNRIMKRAREVLPDLGIVVMSGYSRQALQLTRDARTAFLEKPFRVDDLETTIRDVFPSRAPVPSSKDAAVE